MSELKPCPMCEHKAELIDHRLGCGVICTHCGVTIAPQCGWTKSAAVSQWNRRASDDTITEQEKVISELVDKIQLNTEILTAIMERKPLQGSDYHAISCTIKNNELLIAKHKQSKGE